MDEDLYRSTYNELNPNRCIFEKSITNQRCNCERKHRFVLASREGIACNSKTALSRCTKTLNSIRDNARFSLKVITVNGPMPHNKELRIQVGGMLALQKLVGCDNPSSQSKKINNNDKNTTINTLYQQVDVANIHQILENALQEYGSLEEFPFGEIVKTIVTTKSRQKRQKK